tara:strand:+ start:1462 stop:1839 length:378 start_codon:yes stop_codon:yes gene_type:complete
MAKYSTRVIVTLDFDNIPEREEVESTLLDIIEKDELVYETVISPVSKPLVSIKVKEKKGMSLNEKERHMLHIMTTLIYLSGQSDNAEEISRELLHNYAFLNNNFLKDLGFYERHTLARKLIRAWC